MAKRIRPLTRSTRPKIAHKSDRLSLLLITNQNFVNFSPE